MLVSLKGVLFFCAFAFSLAGGAEQSRQGKLPITSSEHSTPGKKTSNKSASSDSKTPAKEQTDNHAEKSSADFMEIHEVQTRLPHVIWYIPGDCQFVSVQILFKNAGTKNINQKHPALSEFFSVLLKGCGKLDEYQVQKKFFENGSSCDLDFTRDHFIVSLWSPVSTLRQTLKIVIDAILVPRLSRSDFQRAREDAIASLNQNMGMASFYEKINAAYYPEFHPYRKSLSKFDEDLRKVTPKDLRGFLRLLGQDNAIVVVYGPRDHEQEITSIIEQSLLRLSRKSALTISSCEPALVPPEDLSICTSWGQTAIYGRIPGFYFYDPMYHAKALAFEILAGGANSILFHELREKLGCIYSFDASVVVHSDDAFLEVFTVTKNEHAKQVRDATLAVLKRVCSDGFSQEDFESNKQAMLGKFVTNMDSSTDKAAHCANWRIGGKSIDSVQKEISAVENVSFADVNQVSKCMCKEGDLKFVSMGGNS